MSLGSSAPIRQVALALAAASIAEGEDWVSVGARGDEASSLQPSAATTRARETAVTKCRDIRDTLTVDGPSGATWITRPLTDVHTQAREVIQGAGNRSSSSQARTRRSSSPILLRDLGVF